MNPIACTSVLSSDEVNAIHEHACRVLREIGIRIESPRMRDDFAKHECIVNHDEQRVTFPQSLIDTVVSNTRARPQAWRTEVRAGTGGYPPRYIDPESGEVKSHTVESVSACVRLADALPNINSMNILGFPYDVPPRVQPLYNKFIGWRNTQKPFTAWEMHDVGLAPYYRRVCEIYCDYSGAPFRSECQAELYMDHPFRISRSLADTYYALQEAGVVPVINMAFPIMGL